MTPVREVVASGPHLQLARFQVTDLAAVHAFASDPVVCRYTTWGPNALTESRAFLEEAMDDDPAGFVLAVLSSGQVIGSAAVWVTSAADRVGELGYTIARAYWGCGYATEVARILVRIGFERLGLERIAATCHPDNKASARVLEKSALQFEGRLRGNVLVRGQRRDSLLYGILRTDS